MRQQGSILVGLLWCLSIVALTVIGLLHTSRVNLRAVGNAADAVQAHYLALAGIEKTKALLYADAQARRQAAQHHRANLADDPGSFRQTPLGRGHFSVLRAGTPEEGGGVLYGVSDEEARLNVNTASAETLAKLRGMTPDLIAALIDWRDSDQAVSVNGAEGDYYAALVPPIQIRNGSIETLRELLMIRGMTRAALFGDDLQQTGLSERDVLSDTGRDEVILSSVVDRGWAAWLTTHSFGRDVNAAGEPRVNLKSADETALARVRGFSPEIAKAIVAHRGQSQLESLADLLEVGAAANDRNAPPNPNAATANPSAPRNSGARLIDTRLLMEAADDLTVSDEPVQTGLINVNSAGLEVLACLPGMTRETAQAVIAYRSSSGFLPNIAALLQVPGITTELFKQLAPWVTVRSETYRILAEGTVPSSGAVRRLEVVVRINPTEIQTLAYREDDL